eukprot:scaffold221503_cov19-Prasinocladus_malaysianus.AAC.1
MLLLEHGGRRSALHTFHCHALAHDCISHVCQHCMCCFCDSENETNNDNDNSNDSEQNNSSNQYATPSCEVHITDIVARL